MSSCTRPPSWSARRAKRPRNFQFNSRCHSEQIRRTCEEHAFSQCPGGAVTVSVTVGLVVPVVPVLLETTPLLSTPLIVKV